MNGISKLLITPLSRESIARLVITPQASLVSDIDQVSVSRVASPFSGISRLIVSALSVILVLAANAQNVGDFILNEKTASTGRVTLRSWPKGANTLWGTDANGLPQKIIIGSGLSLGSGSLIATGGTISWSSLTGKPSTFPPEAHNQSISTITGLQDALDAKASAVEPSLQSALTIADINDPANNGTELNGILIQTNRDNLAQNQQQIVFGNGDKTGRVVAPALADDYLWYLPQATGTVMLDSDNSGGIAASRLTSGTIASARLPTTITGLSSVTSTTFVGALTGTASGNLVAGGALGTPSSGVLTNCTNIPAAQLTGTINTARLPATITGLTSVTSTAFVGSPSGSQVGVTVNAQTGTTGNLMLGQLNSVNRFLMTPTGAVQAAQTQSSTVEPAFGHIGSPNSGLGFRGSASSTTGILSAGIVYAEFGPGVRLGQDMPFQWTGSATPAATGDTSIFRDGGAGIIAMRVGTTAHALRVYNTYTSATNNELAVIDWKTTANTLRLGTDKGSGGGSNRAVQIVMGGTVKITLQTDGNVLLHGLPTSAPATSNAIWRDDANGGVLKQVP